MSAQGEEPVVVRILRAEAMDDTRLCDEQGLLICGVIDDATHYVEARDVIEAYDAASARAEAAKRDARGVINVLGFFASCIKSGEPWTDECEKMLRAAFAHRDASLNTEVRDE